MTFTKVHDVPSVVIHRLKRGKNQIFLQKFIDAHIAIAQINFSAGEYSSIDSCQAALAQSARNMHLDHIKIISRGGKVYVINTLLLEDNA